MVNSGLKKSILSAWALDCSGQLIHISDAKKQIDYYCPFCKKELISKQGEIKAHHFAHKSSSHNHGYESIIHSVGKMVTKELIENNMFNYRLDYIINEYSKKHEINIHEPSEISFSKIFKDFKSINLEKKLSENLIPDITIVDRNGNIICIEIGVKNLKKRSDISKYKSLDVSVLEIVLSDLAWGSSKEAIQKAINSTKNQKWHFVSDALDNQKNNIINLAVEKSRLEKAEEKNREKSLLLFPSLLIENGQLNFILIPNVRLEATKIVQGFEKIEQGVFKGIVCVKAVHPLTSQPYSNKEVEVAIYLKSTFATDYVEFEQSPQILIVDDYWDGEEVYWQGFHSWKAKAILKYGVDEKALIYLFKSGGKRGFDERKSLGAWYSKEEKKQFIPKSYRSNASGILKFKEYLPEYFVHYLESSLN